MKNYSRQREAILQALRSTDTHPTARAVFEKVRESYPNISLGTVYRNLSQLSETGEILNLSVGDGNEHFDGDTLPHLHLVCKNCGKIEDLPVPEDVSISFARKHGFEAENAVHVLYGFCEECRGTKNRNDPKK